MNHKGPSWEGRVGAAHLCPPCGYATAAEAECLSQASTTQSPIFLQVISAWLLTRIAAAAAVIAVICCDWARFSGKNHKHILRPATRHR